MKLIITFALALLSFHSLASNCTNEWKCSFIPYFTHVSYPVTSILGASPDEADVFAKIRAGYMEENKNVPFKGNILYFEGLADSMLNHKPLFDKLVANGFRVIAFDYMGQGGSTGSMNDTRIKDIPVLGQFVYRKYAREIETYKKPIIIGWSTGGLAAYLTALDNTAEKVVLIAPAIVPRIILGEQNFWELEFDQITLNTLSSKRYKNNEYNPHVEGIRPKSPLDAKDFATDLILTSLSARFKKVESEVKGLVLLSGKSDSYVHSIKGSIHLSHNASNFKQVLYSNSLHEIDNEVSNIQEDAQKKIVNFLLNK